MSQQHKPIKRDNATTIPVRKDTHERAKRLKRGGETWSQLVDRMADQYDSEAAVGDRETDADE